MSEWFNFALYALSEIVSMIFRLDTGLGFSLGDFDVAALLIGLIASALVVKASSSYTIRHELNNPGKESGVK